MFKKLASLLLRRKPHVERQQNPGSVSVPAFNADLRAKGLNDDEISKVLVLRTVTGMLMLREQGYTDEQIDRMPAARYLAVPTDRAGKKRYYECMAGVRFRARFRNDGPGF